MTPPLIFLDIDGCLNSHDFDWFAMSNPIHRNKVKRLNRILAASNGRIVLSSAWRYIVHRGEADLAGFDWLLRSHGVLCNRLIGITRCDTMMPKTFDGTPGTWPLEDERGRQIADWLADHDFSGRYVVIDDGGKREDGSWTDLGIGAAGHPHVCPVGSVGLTDADADRAIEILMEGDVIL